MAEKWICKQFYGQILTFTSTCVTNEEQKRRFTHATSSYDGLYLCQNILKFIDKIAKLWLRQKFSTYIQTAGWLHRQCYCYIQLSSQEGIKIQFQAVTRVPRSETYAPQTGLWISDPNFNRGYLLSKANAHVKYQANLSIRWQVIDRKQFSHLLLQWPWPLI